MSAKVKRAIISGVTGQDGSYLAELLLSKGYEVHGLVRRCASPNRHRIAHLCLADPPPNRRLHLHVGDLASGASVCGLVQEIMPDEVYHLGAMSYVPASFDDPEYTLDINATGTVRMLEAIRQFCPGARFYQASSSEMFGDVVEMPQTERTPFRPRSPYGCSKVAAFYLTVNYRDAFGLHASNGILFNHESERRGKTFVTRKITRAAARIKLGLEEELALGNLDAKRDWGHAKDYVRAMWMLLQQDQPDDVVIATGVTHSVREFCEISFGMLGLDYREYVVIDPNLLRPAEVQVLLGDASRAKVKLGWTPQIGFEELIRTMVEHDLALARREALQLASST